VINRIRYNQEFPYTFSGRHINLQRWLEAWLKSPLFLSVMKKYPLWDDIAGENQQVLIDGDD
jgi:hypothetical protein